MVMIRMRTSSNRQEKVEMVFDKWLMSIPSRTVDISSFGLDEGRAQIMAIGEDGTKIESSSAIPASDDVYQYMPVESIDNAVRAGVNPVKRCNILKFNPVKSCTPPIPDGRSRPYKCKQ